jgi:lipopolysaccharide/colanic/teichoic acid biosynthesis glycosyltransferase
MSARDRIEIAPRITELWQVNGKDNVSFKEMICLAVGYRRPLSLLLDLKLLAATIPTRAGELRKATKRRLGQT